MRIAFVWLFVNGKKIKVNVFLDDVSGVFYVNELVDVFDLFVIYE